MVVGWNKNNSIMTLTKYKSSPTLPTSSVDRLASEIFGQNIGRLFGSDGFMTNSPRVNIVEGKDDFRVEMEAPGFDKKDLHVEMVADTLTIRGEHTEDNQDIGDEERWTRREFQRQAFERSFVLPNTVDMDGVKATYKNGLLQLTIPKREEAKPRTLRIDVK